MNMVMMNAIIQKAIEMQVWLFKVFRFLNQAIWIIIIPISVPIRVTMDK